MAFFGPGVTLNTKPRWRQGWWWREKLPRIAVWLGFAALVVGLVWVVFVVTEPDDTGGAPRSSEAPQTATPTPDPTPTGEEPPPFPDAARQPTEAGLEAAVRYQVDAINYGQRTGDTEPLKQIYDLTTCVVCAGVLDDVEDATVDDSYLKGGEYTVVSATRTDLSPQGRGQYDGVVELSIKRDTGRQLAPDGRVLRPIEAIPASVFELTLSFGDGAWQITASKVTEVGR